jgi:Cu-Zn family superoxide dismutase
MNKLMIVCAVAVLIGGCAGGTRDGAGTGRKAEARIVDSAEKPVARATFAETRDGVRVVVTGQHLPPGTHGVHIHAVGSCRPPAFESAGDHLNPGGKKHGRQNPEGMHAGDLPNLVVGANGEGRMEQVIRSVTLDGGPDSLMRPGGTAIVIHADPDDQKTDPSGGSGARIACGVISS